MYPNVPLHSRVFQGLHRGRLGLRQRRRRPHEDNAYHGSVTSHECFTEIWNADHEWHGALYNQFSA